MRLNLAGLSDTGLVLRVQASGDRDAYGELVRRHQAGLRAFLWRLAGAPAPADDLAQETMIRAYDRIAGFRGGAAFRSWLYAIGYREFLRSRRKAAVQARVLAAMADDAEEGGMPADPDAVIDIQRCLQGLPVPERAALLLCDACGMSHSETAEAMGLPLGTIKTYVQRARRRMRAAMETEPAHRDEPRQEVPCRIAR